MSIYVINDNNRNYCFTEEEYMKLEANNNISPYTGNQLDNERFIELTDKQSCISGLRKLTSRQLAKPSKTEKKRFAQFELSLLMWSEYGESPQNLFDDNVKKLRGYTIKDFSQDLQPPLTLDQPLYRFVKRDRVTDGDGKVVDFINPTSWSPDLNIVQSMAEGDDAVFLKIEEGSTIRGVFNYKNMYTEEQEHLLSPMVLEIMDDEGDGIILVKDISNEMFFR